MSTNIKTAFYTLMAVTLWLTSCKCDLPGDEEIRESLIGQWEQDGCWHPHTLDNEGLDSSPLLGYIIFQSDGSFIEAGYDTTGQITAGAGPRAYCIKNACDTNDYCTCRWSVSNGVLTLTNEAFVSDPSRLEVSYPIFCLDRDQLVFDHMVFNGVKRKKACFNRYNGYIKLD